jgi:predicted MFS family arabinose efflux permease
MINTPSSHQHITASQKYFMALACGVVVANLYYCQPLLGSLAKTFNTSETGASWINICCQLGYGLGLFFVVPLGDMVSRRKLLVRMQIAAAAALCGAALSQSIAMLYFFSICVGIATTACQVFVPLAAHLASDEERGKVIGTLMGGLLSGILLSRTLSGFAADYWGWRSIYWIAAVLMIIFAILTTRFVPSEKHHFEGNYRSLMYSLFSLVRSQPVARQSAWIGACLFGAISAFWSTMAFFLEKPPFSYSLSVIGLFGFVGLSGAFISPLAGRLSDKKSPLFPMRWGFLAMVIGYLILFKSSWSIAILIVGIMLIDMGLQAAHIPNLTRVSALQPDARTRLNTIYMTSFFIGGTLGSIIGSYAWTIAGWTGVCTVGLVLVIAGSLPILIRLKKKHNETV